MVRIMPQRKADRDGGVLAERASARRPRRALHSEAADRLRRLIVRGTLRSGIDIAETELCTRLGMSRTPLREAMKLLAAEGLVQLRRNGSARVTTIDPAEVRELFEAVTCVERASAELAAVRMILQPRQRGLQRGMVRLEMLDEIRIVGRSPWCVGAIRAGSGEGGVFGVAEVGREHWVGSHGRHARILCASTS